MDEEKSVTVCSECLCASCWHGEFMCEEARFAKTVEMPIAQLKVLALENPEYWCRNND